MSFVLQCDECDLIADPERRATVTLTTVELETPRDDQGRTTVVRADLCDGCAAHIVPRLAADRRFERFRLDRKGASVYGSLTGQISKALEASGGEGAPELDAQGAPLG